MGAVFLSIHTAVGRAFDQTAVVRHRIIKPETAGEVVAVKAVTRQNTAGDIAAQAALTDHIDRFTGLERIQPLPQFIHRDIAEALDMSLPVFLRRAHIQQDSARNRLKFLHAPFLLI